MTAEITNLGTVSYSYNNANQRTTMTAADRPPVNYGYDTAGRLQTISQTTGGVTELFTYGYDPLSRRTQLQRQSNGAGIVTTDYEYDEISRLKRLKHTRVSTGTLHEDFQYEYNLDDEIAKITSLASAPLTPPSKTATTADAANRIGQFGTASYSFNQEGQTTAKTDVSGTTGYQWDARGRLTRATLPSGQTVDYGYDALGRRVNRAASGLATTFQYDGADVVIDRESGGSTYDYLNGLGVDDKLRRSGGIFGTLYFLQDNLSSTTALTGTGGAVIEQRQYEAFGANTGSVRTRYGYTGRERDELTGLSFYRSRWYDLQQGRFLTEDPIDFESAMNFYSYVGNSPVIYSDPFGLERDPVNWKFGPKPKPSDKIHGDIPKCTVWDDCAELGRKIQELTRSVRQRRDELDPESEKFKGHLDRWRNEKINLNDCLVKYARQCNDCDPPLVPVFDPKEADEAAREKAPRTQGLRDFVRRGGADPLVAGFCVMFPAACLRLLKPSPGRVPVPVPIHP